MSEVPVVPPLKRMDIRNKSKLLLLKCQPDVYRGRSPFDAEEFFELDIPELTGVDTSYKDLSYLGGGTEGYTDAANKESFVDIALYEATDTPTKRRFRATTTHESSHCLMHVNFINFISSVSGGQNLRRAARRDIPAYIEPEWQAWEMAGHLLMPYHLAADCVSRNYSDNDIAKRFDVNPAFVRVVLRKWRLR